MTGASLSALAKLMRKPWYKLWQLIDRCFYRGQCYSILVPFGYRTLTPWHGGDSDPDFAEASGSVRSSGPMTVTIDRCYFLFKMVQQQCILQGDLAECGVYVGSTAQYIAWALERYSPSTRRLHLFDTFCGMPKTSVPSRDYHSPEDFSDTSLDLVRRRLAEYAPFCTFHPGSMPDTFAKVRPTSTFSLVHVDVDIYPSVLACCEWFWPRMIRGGVMIFDDYGFYPYRYSAKASVDDYFSSRWEKPILLPTGQAMAIKTDMGTQSA